MQADMFLLAERLVVAVERMSQDVNNISAYVYDLSYNVQHFINEKREKEDISSHARSEDSWQEDGISPSHIDNLQDKEIAAQDVASRNVDHNKDSDVLSAFPGGIKEERLSENEKNYDSCGVHNISGDERKTVREVEDVIDISDDSLPCKEEAQVPIPTLAQQNKGSSREINQRPHLQSSGLSSSLETPSSSSQCPSVEAIGIKTEEHFLMMSCPPEQRTMFPQNLDWEMPCAVASSSTANVILGETETAEGDLTEGHGGEQLAGLREDQYTAPCGDRTHASYQLPHLENTTLRSASMECSFESNGKAFECLICKKQFAYKSILVNHIRQHPEERPYKCSQCGKSFKLNAHLRTHLQFHKSERPFKCRWCEKAFVQKSDLTNHVRTHTGERPFKCRWCEKAFVQKSDLTNHVRTHTGERPFKCRWCEKAFVQAYHLTKHVRTHTGERPFTCKVCGKSFARKDHISVHMATHGGGQPYLCTMCGVRYNSSKLLSDHIQHVHAATSSAS